MTPLPDDPDDPRRSGRSGRSADEFQIAYFRHVLQDLVTRTSLRCDVFLTFSYPSHLKHLLLRAFLESCFPEMLSKVGVLDGRGMKKSEKHHAIALACVHGPCPWTMVHGPWSVDRGAWSMDHGALGELWASCTRKSQETAYVCWLTLFPPLDLRTEISARYFLEIARNCVPHFFFSQKSRI